MGAGLHLESVAVEGPNVSAEQSGTPDVWGTQPLTLRLGGPADLWDDAWTVEDLNSPELAVIATVRHDGPGGADVAMVDGVRLIVSYMTSSSVGPAQPSVVTQGALADHQAWVNPAGAAADNATDATVTLAPAQMSQPLLATGFGFMLPEGAVPRGVEVELEVSGTMRAFFVHVSGLQLVANGAPLAANPLDQILNWEDELSLMPYGAPTDSWHAALTRSLVMDPTFGFQLDLLHASLETSITASVHSLRMTVHYDVVIAQSARVATTAMSQSNSVAWANLDNVRVEDDMFARAAGVSGDEGTDVLTATGFGFTLPASAVVHGVEVTVRRQTSSLADSLRDSVVKLLSGGTTGGGNRALTTTWQRPFTNVVYGGTTDLWGQSWTAAQVNDPSFGVAMAARYVARSGNDHARVDSVQMAVTYCVP